MAERTARRSGRVGGWVGWGIGLWLGAVPAWGARVKLSNLAMRVRAVDRIVVAEVGASRVELPGGDPHRMRTVTGLSVLEDVKGTGPAHLRLVRLGGHQGPWRLEVSNQVAFREGELALLFLRCRDPKHPDLCTLWGGQEGKLSLVERDDGVAARVQGRTAMRGARVPLGQLVDAIRAVEPRGGR